MAKTVKKAASSPKKKSSIAKAIQALVRADYFADVPLTEISQKHGIPYATIRDWISTKKWAELRKNVRRKSVDVAVKSAVKTRADDLFAVLVRDRRQFVGIYAVVLDRYFSTDGKGAITGMKKQTYYTRDGDEYKNHPSGVELQSLARALETIKKLEYRTYGWDDTTSYARMNFLSRVKEIAARARKCKDLDELMALAPDLLEYVESPSEGVGVITAIMNKERLDHQKSQSLSKKEFEKYLQGLRDLAETCMARDPETLAAFAQGHKKLLQEID